MNMPPCFYPTTVCMVDDELHFLERLRARVDQPAATTHLFGCPLEGLEYLSSPESAWDRSLLANTAPFEDITSYDMRIIHEDPTRRAETSVVILDYNMPVLTGLELSAQIPNPHIKKILLTGVADEDIAIEAFHQGLIHAYVHKNDPRLVAKLRAHIYRLQLAYFNDIFRPSVERIRLCGHVYGVSPFFTTEYATLLQTKIQDVHAVAYYLCEYTGTVKLYDAQGRGYGLVIRTDQDYADIKGYIAYEALPQATQRKLAQKKLILCNDGAIDNLNEPCVWESRLKPAQTSANTPAFSWYFGSDVFQAPAVKTCELAA